MLVFGTGRSRELDHVVENADAPLMVGPGALRSQQVDEVRTELIEEGDETLAVGREESVDHIGDFAKDVDVVRFFVFQLFLNNLKEAI